MKRSSDDVLDRARVREVTGVFHSHDALEAAVDSLLLAGFDRADIDRVASLDEVWTRLGSVYVAPEDLADVKHVPRAPIIKHEDIALTRAICIGVPAFLGAAAAALLVVASGGTAVAAGIVAGIAGAVGGGIGAWIAARLLQSEHAKGLDAHMAARGLILWVRVRSPEKEAQAQEILLAHGADAVRIHEIEIEKRVDEIPLSSLRPDPWLGEERLGRQ